VGESDIDDGVGGNRSMAKRELFHMCKRKRREREMEENLLVRELMVVASSTTKAERGKERNRRAHLDGHVLLPPLLRSILYLLRELGYLVMLSILAVHSSPV